MFRVELVRWFILSAWCLSSVQAAAIVTKSAWTWNSTGDQCRPMICSCYMNGVYYDEGDEWNDPEDPCIRYRCLQNGFYKPIQTGCNFKGVCKKHNETWSEGCFTYHCEKKKGDWRYTLIQPGCATRKGDCLQVGERYVELCDTYECQIVGSCYTLVKVKSGCKAKNDVCMPVYSFWHDECAVYQCKLDKGKSKSIIQTHSHDVMVWPRGEYALLETVHGCPTLYEQFWKEGFHEHWGDGHNDYSYEYDLKGNKSELMMQHYFCVHDELNDTGLIPVYQTYWEEGKYCILAYNGTCPKGFQEGMVIMADESKNETNTTWGTLPDGVFNNLTTTLYFCCRYDGEIKKPIVLPSRHPFALFMAANESKCQEVRGMTYKIEFFSHDDLNNGTLRELHGALPSIKTADDNTLIYVCYYSPVMCGCVNGDENFVAVNDIIEKSCVKYQCFEMNFRPEFIILEGGCKIEGKDQCVAENETWVEKHGEACFTKQCVRHTDNTTGHVSFVVITILKECRDGEYCRPLTYTKTHGCYSAQCQESNITGEIAFEVTEAACSDGYGHCIEVGKTIKKGCMELKCIREISKCALVPFKGGCSFNGKCYGEGAYWSYSCSKFTCINNSNKTHFQWKSQTVSKGCLDYNGKCRKEGDKVTNNCVTYECIWEDKPGFYPVDGGCLWHGKCYDANSEWKERCSTYNCTVLINGTHTQRTVMPVQLGCKFNDKCVNTGGTYKYNCVTYLCNKTGSACGIKVTAVGCKNPNTGKCVAENATMDFGCNTYKCVIQKTKKGYRRTSRIVSSGCTYKKKCYKQNETLQFGCQTYICSTFKKNGKIYVGFKFSSYGCKYKGVCYKANETFHDGCRKKACHVYVKGKRISYKIVSLNCMYNGHCYEMNQSIQIRCTNYTCLERHDNSCQRVGMTRTSIACTHPTEDKCVPANATVDSHCATYKCRVKKTSKGYMRMLNAVSAGCIYKGKCYKLNETFERNCIIFKCYQKRLASGRIQSSFKIDSYGCKRNGHCRKANETFLEGCSKKACHVYRKGNGIMYKIVSLNCKYNGHCYDINQTVEFGCANYTCMERHDNSCQRVGMIRTSVGCPHMSKDQCVPAGSTVEINCAVYKCRVTKTSTTYTRGLRVISAGCRTHGKCLKANATQQFGCNVYKCVEKQLSPGRLQSRTEIISYGCKSDEGKCYKPDSKEKYKRNVLYEGTNYTCDCQCKRSGKYSKHDCGGIS